MKDVKHPDIAARVKGLDFDVTSASLALLVMESGDEIRIDKERLKEPKGMVISSNNTEIVIKVE